MTQTPKVPLVLAFPEGEKTTRYGRPSYEAACYGHERIAVLLDYFVYQASLEIDRLLRSEPCPTHGQSCNGESCKNERAKGCKVVKVERSHADIFSKLPFHLCRKTLINYLDKLNAWGYVASEDYGRDYTVSLEAIQAAISTPPEPEKRTHVGGRKRCKDGTNNERTSSACESCKVVKLYVEELEQKVVMLQQNVVSLQLKVVNLQHICVELQLYNPPSAPSAMRFDGPFASLLSFTDITTLSCDKDIVGSALASPTPPVSPEQTSSSVRVVEPPMLPPNQATPTPVVVEAPDVRLTTSEQPPTVLVQQRGITQEKRPPRTKKEETSEDEALTVRCRQIQAKINELRGFPLKKTGLIIDERKVIRDHLDGFSDERIERIHQWIVTNIWKYKSVGGRGDVGARIIWEEAERAEAAMREPRASPTAGRVIPMKVISSFDDPDYRMEDEFYKPEHERERHAQADSTLTSHQAVAYAGTTDIRVAAW